MAHLHVVVLNAAPEDADLALLLRRLLTDRPDWPRADEDPEARARLASAAGYSMSRRAAAGARDDLYRVHRVCARAAMKRGGAHGRAAMLGSSFGELARRTSGQGSLTLEEWLLDGPAQLPQFRWTLDLAAHGLALLAAPREAADFRAALEPLLQAAERARARSLTVLVTRGRPPLGEEALQALAPRVDVRLLSADARAGAEQDMRLWNLERYVRLLTQDYVNR